MRFARWLATFGLVAGCGSSSASAVPNNDAAGDGGVCVTFRDADLACGSGQTCLVDEDSSSVVCRTLDAGFLHACGSITCGWDCVCGDPDASVCGCVWGMSGPLLPPDQPAC
ncbi:MAG: hypothetical protein ACXVEF_06615 [Polyangiales bacterium]